MCLWRPGSGERLAEVTAHGARIQSVRFDPAGGRVVSGSADGVVGIFSAETGALLWRFRVEAGVNDAIPVGEAVLTAGEHGRLEQWFETDPRAPVRVLNRGAPLSALALHPVEPVYACGDGLGRLHVGFLPANRMGGEPVGAPEERERVDRPEGRPSGFVRRGWVAHEDRVTGLGWNPAGTVLASAAASGGIRLWDAVTGTLLTSLKEGAPGVSSLVWSAGGEYLASAGEGGMAEVWRVRDASRLQTFRGDQGRMNAIGFLGDTRWLVSGGVDRQIHVWALRSDPRIAPRQIRGPGTVLRLRFAHEAPWWVGGGPEGRLWCAHNETQATIWTAQSGQGRVTALAISPDDHRVLTGGTRGRVEIRSSETGETVREWSVSAKPVRSLAVDPSGRLVAVGGDDRVVRLIDLETGTVEREFPEQALRIGRIAFTADGAAVVGSGADGRLTVWPLEESGGRQPLVLPARPSDFDIGAQDWVVAVAVREEMHVWQLPGATPKVTVPHAPPGPRAVVLTPAGRRFVTTDRPGLLRVWDTRTGIELLHLPFGGVNARDLRFSGDGRHLALVGNDGSLHWLEAGR